MPWLLKTITNEDKPPFFAWLHYFDPHHPHEPPSPYSQSFVHDLYQGEIAFADESFGNIIEQLKKNDVYNNTLIVFTSDHGEGNGEHNESTHSLLVYNSTLHVPLIVKYPNQEFANSQIDQIVGSVDIFPTILNELGIDIPDDIQGHILPTENSNSSNELYAETLSPRFSRGWGEQRALVKNDHKYIYGPIKELYNLKDDPHETNNLIQQKPELAQSMLNDLREYIEENHVSDSEESNIEVDAKTLDTLRGLGYIQSTAGTVNTFEEKLDDTGEAPQKYVNTISIYSTAKQLLYKGKYIEAIRYLDSLLIEDSKNLAYLELKIQALMSLNNYDKVKEILQSLPDDSFGSITREKRLSILATIALDQGDISSAKELFLKAENVKQTNQGQYKLSLIAKTEGNLKQQQYHLNTILETDTTLVKIIDELARSYDLSGDVLNAEKLFIQSIKNNPYNEKSYYNYGVYLNSMYDLNSAEKQFRKAIDINKNYLIAYFALLETLITQNKLSELSSLYESMKNIDSENYITIQAKLLIENL